MCRWRIGSTQESYKRLSRGYVRRHLGSALDTGQLLLVTAFASSKIKFTAEPRRSLSEIFLPIQSRLWCAVKTVILWGGMQLNREPILLDDGRRIF